MTAELPMKFRSAVPTLKVKHGTISQVSVCVDANWKVYVRKRCRLGGGYKGKGPRGYAAAVYQATGPDRVESAKDALERARWVIWMPPTWSFSLPLPAETVSIDWWTPVTRIFSMAHDLPEDYGENEVGPWDLVTEATQAQLDEWADWPKGA